MVTARYTEVATDEIREAKNGCLRDATHRRAFDSPCRANSPADDEAEKGVSAESVAKRAAAPCYLVSEAAVEVSRAAAPRREMIHWCIYRGRLA